MKTVRTISGIETDKKTIQGLGLGIASQDSTADVIKVGILNTDEDIASSISFLRDHRGAVVVDFSSPFFALKELFSKVDLLVLDTQEAESILNCFINSHEAIEEAARQILALGIKSIYIRGEPLNETLWIHDYWTNGAHSFWLTQQRQSTAHHDEIRALFTSAIAACLALGYSLEDALVIAKMYEHQAIRLAQTGPYYGSFPENEADLPYLSSVPLQASPIPFKQSHYLGLYPILDSSVWVEILLQLGVKTLQLRIKERSDALEEEIKRSIALAKKYQATLFINDYWDLALKWNAEAVHLGQEDLETADLDALREKGLLLGVSTYCYYEVAKAHAIGPSYVAIGPVYPTTSKELAFADQGIEQLHRWKRTLHYPLVAIGGINLARVPEVVAAGVSGIALISAITQAPDPEKAALELLSLIG